MASLPTELRNLDILPSSIPRELRRTRVVNGVEQTMAYCINCGKEAAWTPVASCHMTVSYVCQRCYDSAPPDTYIVAENVHFERIAQAQLEHDGRLLSPTEVHDALQDEHHYLSKLKRDLPKPR